MKFKTLENLDILNGLYDLSKPSLKNDTMEFSGVRTGVYIVQRHQEMRLDLISQELYGSTQYVEHLMKLNSILNPFSIRVGDEIRYVNVTNLSSLEIANEDKELKQINLDLVDASKNNGSSTPSEKPATVKPVVVDENNQVVILNNFER